jgi:hypothetical protein
LFLLLVQPKTEGETIVSRGIARRWPALVVACAALVAALGGTVYAAAKINGHSIKPKSLPGNRLVPHSVPANRLKAGTIAGADLAPGSVTGAQVDTATLGQVPSAVHADSADSARDAETALNAVNAVTATKVNGYEAGCRPGTALFAGACWQLDPSGDALKAPQAAAACAGQGGSLPEPLALLAFAQQPGVTMASEEWTGNLTNISSKDKYVVITVTSAGQINYDPATVTKHFRCVMPLIG